ncbi:MAG: serine/threonine protein kinase [Thaumarchaeota archaeon]|nr:serine/threonine protein kinase [Nitrososphaerota archaeon]
MKQSFLPVDRLIQEPYSGILGYPKATKKQIALRIVELQELGISGVLFEGPMTIGTVNVLGKGYAGIVVLAKKGTKKIALKIRRTDSPRKTMEQETILLRAANKAGVGPILLHSSKNFIVMEYLDGKKIFDWISDLRGKGSASKLKVVIKKVLSDCYRLDTAGIDHGELSNITKHVIVGKSVKMIDFESSSLERRVSNVTSATQAIFIGSGLAKTVQKIYSVPPRPKIISVLREYKKQRTQQSFDNVLEILKI